MSGFDPVKFATDQLNEAVRLGKLQEISFVDAKLQWGDLTTEPALNEFVRDLCALANSGQNAVLIFGYPPAGGPVQDAPYAQSKVPDNAMIVQKVQARIYPPLMFDVVDFSYAGRTLSLAHIPPTHNRPHCALKWKSSSGTVYDNAIFWREGSTTCGPNNGPPRLPSRAQLDAMCSDRSMPLGRLSTRRWAEFAASEHELFHPFTGEGTYSIALPIQIQNSGPTSNSAIEMWMSGEVRFKNDKSGNRITLVRRHLIEALVHEANKEVEAQPPLFIPQGGSWVGSARFPYEGKEFTEFRKWEDVLIFDLEIEVLDIFGNRFADRVAIESNPDRD